jgi:hypothetical protein
MERIREENEKYKTTANTLWYWLEKYSGTQAMHSYDFFSIAFLISGGDVVSNSAAASNSIGSGGLRFFDSMRSPFKNLLKRQTNVDAETRTFRQTLQNNLRQKSAGTRIPCEGLRKIGFAAQAVRSAIKAQTQPGNEENEVKAVVTMELDSLHPNDRKTVKEVVLEFFAPDDGWTYP